MGRGSPSILLDVYPTGLRPGAVRLAARLGAGADALQVGLIDGLRDGSKLDDLFLTLSSQAIVRIELGGDHAHEGERFDMGARIRSVVERPEGAIWVLDDDRGDSTGRALKLTPKTEDDSLGSSELASSKELPPAPELHYRDRARPGATRLRTSGEIRSPRSL